MSKLIIPAAELIGTPLTTEELKGIIAGITKYTCECTWNDGKSKYKDYAIGPENAEDCHTSCKDMCAATDTCSEGSLTYSFYTQGN